MIIIIIIIIIIITLLPSKFWLFKVITIFNNIKKPQSPTVKYRIADQGIFVGVIAKASAASLKVTDLLFAFAFCKK